ncbi:MAG TPA: MBL fold metallo-hydrolase [Gemmatimonadales bacterium]|nr:MBL fold metallo-hydrolase [Gemmatimonadales bacterium]
MKLVRTFNVGALRCHTLEGGLQRLDGGAMFGVVPRPLWERAIAPDERHRIPLAMRCLLVEHPDGLVLIDTALGGKEDAKFKDIYGIENESRGVSHRTPEGGTGTETSGASTLTQLDDALEAAGFTAADIRWVINTHLHFDHAGGNTRREPAEVGHDEGALRVAFPNATYVVQRGELEFARNTNERTRASYLPPNFEPVAAAGKFKLLNGDAQVLPGIRVRLTPGHVPHHQAVLVEDGGETTAFIADLIPTSAHLRLPWIMGYDLEPLRTLESKRAILRDAANEGWRLVFEHDAFVAWGTVVRTGTSVGLEGVEQLGSASAP